MKISKRGLDELIKQFEGYHSKQPDGSCKAYRCPAGVWTCGWGCTEGVNQHTHWSEADATEALAAEMAKHEANVEAFVKVPLLQGQFDALVSLCYNVGAGNLKSSSLLQHLNAGDYPRAASHFADWKYSRVSDPKLALVMKVTPGAKAVLPGLVRRRSAEAAMFLEAMDEQMVQKVEPPRRKLDIKQAVVTAGGTMTAAGAAVKTLTDTPIPAPPAGITDTIANFSAWGKLLPAGQAGVLVVGAAAFALTAGVLALVGRLRS